jgi:hypothetical protein
MPGNPREMSFAAMHQSVGVAPKPSFEEGTACCGLHPNGLLASKPMAGVRVSIWPAFRA